MKRIGRIGFLVAFLVVSIFHSDMLYSQVAVRSLDCESCVIEFDNPSSETKTVELLTKSADDTLVFVEDFSNFPHAQNGGMICNSMIPLRLPDSYTLHSACRAKRVYSPNGDTCFFNTDGEFFTPLLDLSAYKDTLRLSFSLKTEANYACTFSVHSVDESGNETLIKQITMPKNSTYAFDSLIQTSQNLFSLKFSTTSFVAMDNLSLSSYPLTTTLSQSMTTDADSCVFNDLLPNTKYYCTISGTQDTISFTSSQALKLGNIVDLSPFTATISADMCANLSNPRYVLRTLSDENTIYATDLFFSQVASTNTYNRAIEIYNGTGQDICLQPYSLVVDLHTGTGNYSSTKTLTFTDKDTIKSDSCIVIIQGLHAMTENSNGVFYVNPSIFGQSVIDGNDPFALIKGNDTVDIFGNFTESVNNTQAWMYESIRTAKTVLKRLPWVSKGVKSNPQIGFPTLETQWQQLGNLSNTLAENFADFGSHTMDGALSGMILDSVVVNLESVDTELELNNLQSHTTYEIYLLAETLGQTIRSNTLRFKTGKQTQRTESGHWFDENWTNGIPDSIDEAVVYNPQTLIIPENSQARCYRLLIKDTAGSDKVSLYNNGILTCKDGVYVEMNLQKNSQDSVSYHLFGFPVYLNSENRDSLFAVLNSQSAIEIMEYPQQSAENSFSQSYVLKLRDNVLLSFKGSLNSEQSYSLISENSQGLFSQNQTLLSYNPYPFSVSVNQLLREGVSMPQVLNSRTGVFEPLETNDSLKAFEGFLVERNLENANLIITSTSLSPVPNVESEYLKLCLEDGEKSDNVLLRFDGDFSEGYDILRDCHKFSVDDNAVRIAYNKESEMYSLKNLPAFEDSISLEFELNIPTLGVYSLKLKDEFAQSCIAKRLIDKQSGVLLFDFAQDSIYTFQSSKTSKQLVLKLYKTLASLQEVQDDSHIALSQRGNVLKVQSGEKIERIVLSDVQGRNLKTIYSNKEIILPNKGIFFLNVKTNKRTADFKVVNVY